MDDDFESFLQQSADPSGATSVPSAAPASTPDADSFEGFLQSQKSQYQSDTTQRAQAIAVSNSQDSADTAGKAAVIGRKIGAPQAAIETDLPRYEAQAKAQENAQILASDPKLAQWVANNPDSARVAQDDFKGMSDIAGLVSNDFANAPQTGIAKGFASGIGSSFVSSALALNRSIGGGLGLVDNALGTHISDWWNQHMVAPQLQNRAALETPADASFGTKAAGTVGNMLGTLAQIVMTGGGRGWFRSVSNEIIAVEGITEAVAHGSRAMVFPSLTAAVNTGKDVYDQTGDIGQAVRASQMAYATTTLGGIVPLGAPGGLGTRLVTGAISGAVTGEVSRQAMNLVNPQQQGFDPEQMILSGLGGAVMSGAMGPRALNDGVRQAYADSMNAESAERGGDAIAKLSELSAASKLREHDPQAFSEYVRQASEDGALTDVYVDGNVLADALHQSAIDPDNIPGLPERISEAQRTGGDVQIPIEDYATHIAGTDVDKSLLPNLKVEEGHDLCRGQQFFQNAKEDMTTRAQEIADQHQQETTGNDEVKAIGDKLFEQMQATGHFTDDVSRASVAPVTEFYRTMAERLGMSPGDLYEKAPLRIVGEDVGGGLKSW